MLYDGKTESGTANALGMGFVDASYFTKFRFASGYLLFVGRTRRITQCLTPTFVALCITPNYDGFYCCISNVKGSAL